MNDAERPADSSRRRSPALHEPRGEPSVDDLLAPEGYTGAELIASSGRGDIYRAKDRAGHEVAIRVLTPAHFVDRAAHEAFSHEARASLRLHHPHIVRSIATGERDDRRWLTMELVDGQSLRARVDASGPLSEREAIALLGQMAQALGYAWRHGVAHRDVTASNILLGPARVGHREPFCAKLATFGLARLRDPGRVAESEPGDDLRGPRADIRALAAAVCWALTPSARNKGGGSTLILGGVSPEAMQLMGAMLNPASNITSWEAVLERLRQLPSPVRQRAH